MINNNAIVVYDLETDSPNPYACNIWEIGAIVLCPRTLTPKEGEVFQSFVKPAHWKEYRMDEANITVWDEYEKETQGARNVNKISIETIKTAPDEGHVIRKFDQFIKKHTKGHITKAPIAAGFNICNFDNIIMHRMCQKHKILDKDGRSNLFHPRDVLDVMTMCMTWFENLEEGPPKYTLAVLREYFGISDEGAHRALKDIEDTSKILIRFLEFHRKVNHKFNPKFKGCFANEN